MKILAINGSYRAERGRTYFLIERLLEGARQGGAECETVALAHLKMNHCLGCSQCQRNAVQISAGEYELNCVYKSKDDVQSVFDKMAAADLIVFATPVYVFGMSTLLKLLIERMYGISYCDTFRVTKAGLMFHHVNPAISSKPFAALICCDNFENETPKNARDYFKTYSRFMDAPQLGLLVRNGGAVSGSSEQPDVAAFPKLKEVYAAYHQAGLELAAGKRISAATQRKANQEIMPVPLFGLIKQIKWRPFKQKFVEKASQMRQPSHPIEKGTGELQ